MEKVIGILQIKKRITENETIKINNYLSKLNEKFNTKKRQNPLFFAGKNKFDKNIFFP